MVAEDRPLSDNEMNIIDIMISSLSDNERVIAQTGLDTARVRPVNSDGSILEFVYLGYCRPNYKQMPLDVDGEMLDEDGEKILILIYRDINLRVSELEFLRESDGQIISPRWGTFSMR